MGTKRTVAVLVLLGGLFELLNAAVEARAGWGAGRDGGWLGALALRVLAGGLLLVTRGRRGRSTPAVA